MCGGMFDSNRSWRINTLWKSRVGASLVEIYGITKATPDLTMGAAIEINVLTVVVDLFVILLECMFVNRNEDSTNLTCLEKKIVHKSKHL